MHLPYFITLDKIYGGRAGGYIVRKMVIKSLCTLKLSEVLYMVAVHLYEILRRLPDFCWYIHFVQIYNFILI